MLDRIASKSSIIIGSTTTNLAESWMHIRAKFDGGKFHNVCNRGSWNVRCYGAAVKMNLGPQWAPQVWGKCTATVHYFQKLCGNGLPRPSVHRRHVGSNGPEAITMEAGISPSALEMKKDQYLQTHINLDVKQMTAITSQTAHQSRSGVRRAERKRRLTSSHFPKVVKEIHP